MLKFHKIADFGGHTGQKNALFQKDFKKLAYSWVELCSLHKIVFGFSQDHTVFP